MKNLKSYLVLSFMTLLLSAPAHATTQGQINFSELTSHYGEPKVEVNLNTSLMKMIGGFANKKTDPEVANILANLESIKVRVYSLNGKVEKASSTIDRVGRKLKKGNWETLVTVNNNEDNQKVRIFSKSTKKVIDGVVVMVVSPEKDGGEAVFINIVGEIDPDNIAKVTESFDIAIN